MLEGVLERVTDFFGLGEQADEQGNTTYEEVSSNSVSEAKTKKPKVVQLNAQTPSIEIMNPESFAGAADVVRFAQERKIVILKVELLSKEEKRRVVDYASGVITALLGEIKKLSNDFFILIPNGILVSSTDNKGDFENSNNIVKWNF